MVDTRTARQQEGIARWLQAKASGVWSYATGFGKSHTALTVIKQMQAKHPAARTKIVVPTLYLKAQFDTALQKAKLPNVQTWVVNSFVKEPQDCELLIVDEVHSMLGEHAIEFPKTFEVCSATWRLGLSATLTPEEQQKLEELHMPVVDTITMAEALKAGWIAAHKQYNLPIELTPEERVAYDRAHKTFTAQFSKWGHDFKLAMACMSSSEARREHALFMGWKETDGKEHLWSPQSIGAFANIWHRAMKERKYIVDHAAQKYEAALALIHKFPVPTICFSESTTFASELAARAPDIIRAYHSQLPSITEEYTITKTFKTKPDEVVTKSRRISGKLLASRSISEFRQHVSSGNPNPGMGVRVLSTARALDQGADFPELRLGIETSGSGTVRQKVQRTGRVVRRDEGADEQHQQAVYVHIFAQNTYEQAKLKRKQKGMQVQEVTDLSEISF